MSPGRVDVEMLRRRLLALDEALTELGRHAGQDEELLRVNVSGASPVPGSRPAIAEGARR